MAENEKLKKTHWIKHFEALLQRTKFGPKCKNDSKSHIWNSFFENLISGIQYFYIRPHIPLDIITIFFNFRFSITVTKPAKRSEKDHSFYNTVSLKKPNSSDKPQLTWH